jgi:hypothetical protein
MESGGSKGDVYIVGGCFMDKWADRYIAEIGINTPFPQEICTLQKLIVYLQAKRKHQIYGKKKDKISRRLSGL